MGIVVSVHHHIEHRRRFSPDVPEFVVLQVQRKMQLRFDAQYLMQCTPTWSTDSDLKWHVIKALFLYT
ncbi:hypothetical protein EVAR_37991_1 [Eumeta japonica]|uniref:Uncharacterized protein n=1 Tax=Eumeta variegata TaxID=151549 RepID=A0A4C1ZTF8_EUMVA|nr:hypothetical protein EVAR_37991_1 [Eumeta japonica]